MNYHATLIRRERLKRNWSQQGLCKGICSVSYLSKIEQGEAAPAEEILRLLLSRLDLPLDLGAEKAACQKADAAYELFFSGRFNELNDAVSPCDAITFRATSAALDLQLLAQFTVDDSCGTPLEPELEACLDTRQLALQRLLQKRYAEAIRLLPNACTYYQAGAAAYEAGSYTQALEFLHTGYELAAREGAPWLMLLCKLQIGNCFCNQLDLPPMLAHYEVAKRLASALHAQNDLETIAYNTACVQIETGNYEAAYAYFSALAAPCQMELHKLAICCEKTGRTAEALAALDRAEAMESVYPPTALAQRLCGLVRYRLVHPGYLEQAEYGEALLNVFQECRRTLSAGYASFHLPWVLEWYTAARQYKKAFELLCDFPSYPR